MRITSVSFRNVGPFGADGVKLEGFTPGLNVVCETNEFGKSTVLKALETVLFKPFSSADKQVKSLRTAASEDGPEGEITFISEGREYRLFKRFLKQKGARLQDAATGEVLAIDRSAEEALAKLLRSDRFNGGPSGLLWVRQGTSMEGIADDGQIASRLEGELGTLIGGERAREYLTRVEAELAQVLTPKGLEKKTGALSLARAAMEATDSALEEAKRLRDQTTSTGAELTAVMADIDRLSREAEDTKLTEQITETRKAMISARSFANELALVEAQYTQATATAERANTRQTDHIEALVNYNETLKRLAALAVSFDETAETLKTTEAQRADLRAHLAELEARQEEASDAQTRRAVLAHQIQRLEILQRARQHLTARLDQYNLLEDSLANFTETMSEMPIIRREDVEELRQAEINLKHSEMELASLSTQLYLELSPAGRGKVVLKGEALDSGSFELSGGASLFIDGVGTLRSDERSLREKAQQRDRAQTDYSARLSRLEVTDIPSAIKIADQREHIERERKRLITEMTRLAPEGQTALETEINAADTEARALAETVEESGNELSEVDHSDILDSLRTQRAKLEVLDTGLNDIRKANAKLETEQARLRERLAGLNLPEDEAARKTQADRFAAEALKAKTDARAAAAQVATLNARAPEQPLDMLTARLTRLEQVAQHAREGLDALKTKAAVLQAQRAAAFNGEDADAAVASLEAQLIIQKEDLASQVRAKDVRVLLRDTLVATQTRLREAYTAPVTQELAPLLSRVIPGAEAGLGDSLGVDTVQRNGKTEAITQLSGGTQEQFAILTRLAYARLLARSGASAPVILDDALVYADDARRDAMFDVLSLVSSGDTPIQIIYLSCHAGATARLGGTRIIPQIATL